MSKKFLFLSFLFVVSFFSAPKVQAATTLQRIPVNNLNLTAFWSFDGSDYDSSASTAEVLDRSGHGYHLNSRTATRVIGKIGQALNFNGVDSGLENDNGIEGDVLGTGPITVSAWIYPRAYDVHIIGNGDGATRTQFTIDTARLNFSSDGVDGAVSAVNSITLNTWQFVTAVRNSSNLVTFYVNGVQSGTANQAAGGAPSSQQFSYVGRTFAGVNQFDGLIDEVRVYGRAFTATEARNLYQSGSAQFNSSQNKKLTSGLVGLWSFDGADVSGATIYDRSGQGNNATAVATPPVSGKIGQALYFNGTSGGLHVATDLTGSGAVTISAWIYPLEFGGTIFAVGDNTPLTVFATELGGRLYFSHDGATFIRSADASIALNTWQYATLVRNGSGQVTFYVNGVQSGTPNQSAGTITAGQTDNYIGNIFSGNTFKGPIDDFRIYNRALSAAEVKQLYNMGNTPLYVNSSQNKKLTSGLVGLWSFDGPDVVNGVAMDRSGQGNNGNLINISTSTFYTLGKIGQAFNFDGINDYVEVPDPASGVLDFGTATNFTLSAWVNVPSTNPGQDFINKLEFGNPPPGFALAHDNFGISDYAIRVILDAAPGFCIITGTSNIADGKWHHVTGVVFRRASCTENDILIYVDGVQETGAVVFSSSNTNEDLSSGEPLRINADEDGGVLAYIKSKVDEVRIYNRALSAAEVKQLYFMGK